MQKIKLGNRWIGKDRPCFVAVDIGSNHNRNLNIAKRLIEEAAEAKVDAVKFQIYSAENLYSKIVPRHSYYKKNLWSLIKEIETPRQWIPKLRKHCDKNKVIFFATPFDFAAVDELEPYVNFYKMASFELVDLSLIEYTAKKKKPVIISTGLANMGEIRDAYLACRNAGNKRIVFLHCVSSYPADPGIMNLRAMHTIARSFPNGIVGLSDHSLGFHISIAAVAMGAKFIEKHFTLSRKMKGPDHPFSIEPEELRNMVKQIREVESAFGDGKKSGPKPQEMENYRIARRSIHAKVAISKGTRITEVMLIIKRPGFGIKPKFISSVIGKTARRDIEADAWITPGMI